jgi:cyclohexa-1,5-dienecarbonyl-CoA hydratase
MIPTALVRIVKTDAAFWRVTFGGGKGNVLDRRTLASLAEAFGEARSAPELKAIVLEGSGGHFSFGASVQEHLPDQVQGMLQDFHRLIFQILDSHVVVLAAVRGQCLGGGLELASVAHRIFASDEAKFGQPEIALGVFAPFASAMLPMRIRRADAEDLCLTGRRIGAAEAKSMGLVDEIVADDPAEAAMAWARERLGALSASSLRLAVSAIRAPLVVQLRDELPLLETVYLTELMASSDAHEGLRAFLDKRPPVWTHR